MTEQERLAALIDLDLLDTAPEKEYDDLVRLASAICGTPISLVSLVDEERQWFKASFGLALHETPRKVSFCAHAILQPDLFEVEDAGKDPRFLDNALVTGETHLRFYAGVPLQAAGGAAIGTLCVIDTVPRQLTFTQREALTILAAQVQARMELRLKHKTLLTRQRQLERALDEKRDLCCTLEATNDLFQSFMNHGPFASYIKNGEGAMLFYNRYLADLSGVSEQAWIGLRDDEIWPPAMAAKFRSDDLRVLEGGVAVEHDDVSPGPDGSLCFWRTFKFPYDGGNGDRKLAGISIDVTSAVMREADLENALREQGRLAHQLDASQDMFRSFMENIPNHAYVKDDQGRYVFINREVTRFFGPAAAEWVGRTAYEIVSKEKADTYTSQDQQVLLSGKQLETINEITGSDGKAYRFRSVRFTYKDMNGRTMLAEIAQDITEQLRQSEALEFAHSQLERVATTDFLTGLSTRRFFSSRADAEFADWARHDSPLTMLIIDVDNFKHRNDVYGHAAGDEALALVGDILRRCVRSGDTAARLGGEEFAVLLPHTNGRGGRGLADRFQRMLLAEHFGPMPLTVSIGVAVAMKGITGWEMLLSRADEAMYTAKRTGKNKVVAYTAPQVAMCEEGKPRTRRSVVHRELTAETPV